MISQDYTVPVGNTSTVVLETNPKRVGATFVNDSDETIYLQKVVPAVASKGIRLNASGGTYEINLSNPFTGRIEAICASGGKNLCVVEDSNAGI